MEDIQHVMFFLSAYGCLSHKVDRLCLRNGCTTRGERQPNRHRDVTTLLTNRQTAVGLVPPLWYSIALVVYCKQRVAWYTLLLKGTIHTNMCLNAHYATALFEGTVQLHMVRHPCKAKQMMLFPGDDRLGRILCHALTEDFLSYSHAVGVRKVFPDPNGTSLVFIDNNNGGFLRSSANTIDSHLEPSNFPATIAGVLWDYWYADRGVFVAYDVDTVYTYALHKTTIYGLQVVLVGSMVLPFSQKPLLLDDGQQYLKICVGVFLSRFCETWNLCKRAGTKTDWEELVKACLVHMEVELAIQVYRMIGNVGKVLSLQGHLAMFLGMTKDLFQWDNALIVALYWFAEDQIPLISKEYAYSVLLNHLHNHMNALAHYENGMTCNHKELDKTCQAGIARMSIRIGDIRRGVAQAMQHPSRVLKNECGAILEILNQFSETAQQTPKYSDLQVSLFYTVLLYVHPTLRAKVKELLPYVSSPKIHQRKGGTLHVGLESAKDWVNAIRVLLDHLNNVDEAICIVKKTQSIDGAKMVAWFFLSLSNYSSAIQFLVLCQCNNEAFQLAQQHCQMKVYADVIGPEVKQEDHQSITLYDAGERKHLQAGKFFHKCGQYGRALSHFLKCPNTDDNMSALEMAIETVRVVGQAKDSSLTNQLIDYLIGVSNDTKDSKYLFCLYVALQQYNKAARTSIIIAREVQHAAHTNTHSMYCLLHNKLLFLSTSETQYHLLESVKRGDRRLKAAQMFIRVSNNISKIPLHVVPILSSTAIKCHRAEQKNSAIRFATMLRPEHRNKINPKYGKKIEVMLEQESTPCPYCGLEDDTGSKKNKSCLAGHHMLKEDRSACPHCEFPALYSQLTQLLETDMVCPMCSESLNVS
uniref:WDR19 WD40 repeat domain-containing protein n=1 Tax=Mola mola TaxID=94237 RepID=A0A3Q3X5Q6_MOLML